MPSLPPRHQPTGIKSTAERKREYDRQRDAQEATRKLYKTKRWQHRRAVQLAQDPLCAMCQRLGLYVPATVADHVEPHRGDVVKFWRNRLQSLCTPCHSSVKQREEQQG